MGAPVTWVSPDPATGVDKLVGTTAMPLVTATSSLQTTSDLTKSIVSSTTVGTTPIITATAAQRGRVYRLRIDVAGANVLTFTDASGTEEMNFSAAGFKIYDFATRPWFTTAVNTAFSVTTTTTAKVNIVAEYTKAA